MFLVEVDGDGIGFCTHALQDAVRDDRQAPGLQVIEAQTQVDVLMNRLATPLRTYSW